MSEIDAGIWLARPPIPWQPRRVQDAAIASALIAIAALVLGSPLEFRLAGALFAFEGGAWTLRHDWLLQDIMHDGANGVVTWLQIAIVILAVIAWLHPRLKRQRRPLLYLALAMPLATGLVALVKAWTDMDCPYDLIGFGGERAYVGLFETRPSAMADGRCFPAGHAAGGYGFLGLYFLGRRYGFGLPGLLLALGAGLLLGVTQQLRGAHFLSHDLWTLALCWLICWIASELILERPPCRIDHVAGGPAGS